MQLYRTILWATAVATDAVLLSTGFEATALLTLAGFVVALGLAHRRVLVHAALLPATVEVDLGAPSEKFPGGVLAAYLPLVSSALLALWASRDWSRLPQRIPVHFGLHGPDRWVERTTAGVYGFIAAQAALSMLLMLTAWGILHWSRRISGQGTDAASDRRYRRVNVHLLLAVAYFLSAAAWITLLKPAAAGWAGGAVVLMIVVYYFILIRVNRRTNAAVRGDRTPDACWKMGMFYVNAADPSVFVAKRFGIGYTINFGNRWIWAALCAILVAAVTRAFLR